MRNKTLHRIAAISLGIFSLTVAKLPPAFAGDLLQLSRPAKIKFKQFRLKNGLWVLISEDHSAPVFTLNVTYNVGSHDEAPGQTGYAHLFEHMMFKGSENVAEGEHSYLVDSNGGSLNATTDPDLTRYFETLPSNQLDLALFLEADRMRSLAINQENLDNQREAVKEERRMRFDNQPYGYTFPVVLETALDNFAYSHPTIGSMEDLEAATVENVASFFSNYYAPNNAVLTLVGDVDTKAALAKIEKYFSDIPSHQVPADPDLSEPRQEGQRRATIEDKFAQFPRIDVVYKIPNEKSPEAQAVGVMMNILCDGKSSRLHQTLVENQVVIDFGGFVFSTKGPSLAWFVLIPTPGISTEEAEAALYSQIELIKSQKVESWEIAKVRRQLRLGLIKGLTSTESRASMLGETAINSGDPKLVNHIERAVRSVNTQNIQDAANKYFDESQRTVVITLPAANQEENLE